MGCSVQGLFNVEVDLGTRPNIRLSIRRINWGFSMAGGEFEQAAKDAERSTFSHHKVG